MKNTACFLFLCFAYLASFAQYTPELSATLKKNNVAAIQCSSIEIKNGALNIDDSNNQVILLDDSGRLLKLYTFVGCQKSGMLQEFHYNRCSQADTINEYSVADGKQTLTQHAIYYFDRCNMVKQIITDEAGHITGTQITCEYDNKVEKQRNLQP